MADMVRLELARTFYSYFRKKGGGSPSVPSDILPVVILDDAAGPYPAARAWHTGHFQAGAAATYATIGIQNNDDFKGESSVVVIDEIIYRTAVADDVFVCIGTQATLSLGSFVTVADRAEDKDQQASDEPRVGNIRMGVQNISIQPGVRVPGNDIVAHSLKGPFTLGPQAILAVRAATVNVGIAAYFRGRYYASV